MKVAVVGLGAMGARIVRRPFDGGNKLVGARPNRRGLTALREGRERLPRSA